MRAVESVAPIIATPQNLCQGSVNPKKLGSYKDKYPPFPGLNPSRLEKAETGAAQTSDALNCRMPIRIVGAFVYSIHNTAQ